MSLKLIYLSLPLHVHVLPTRGEEYKLVVRSLMLFCENLNINSFQKKQQTLSNYLLHIYGRTYAHNEAYCLSNISIFSIRMLL